jgi:hypothetical protein
LCGVGGEGLVGDESDLVGDLADAIGEGTLLAHHPENDCHVRLGEQVVVDLDHLVLVLGLLDPEIGEFVVVVHVGVVGEVGWWWEKD